jgi:hypothetical protein
MAISGYGGLPIAEVASKPGSVIRVSYQRRLDAAWALLRLISVGPLTEEFDPAQIADFGQDDRFRTVAHCITVLVNG